MNSYTPGHLTGVYWSAVGAQRGSWLNVAEHNLDIEALLYDVTSTDSGGITQRITGKLDASATVRAFLDNDFPPYLTPPAIITGASGALLFFFSAVVLNRPFQVPMTIQKVHYGAKVDGASEWAFDSKLNGLVGQLVYPPQ